MRPRAEVGKVAILGTRGYPSYYGGFETAVRHLAPSLVDAGWMVRVYGRAGAITHDDAARDQRVESVETWGINTKSLSTLSFGASAAFDVIRWRPDVVLVMNVANGFFLPFFKAFGVKSVVNVDGIEWERQKWGRLAKAVFWAGARLTARFADEIVVDAEAIGARWSETFGRSGSFIPYGGTADEPSAPPLGLRGGAYVLYVARFVPENSIEEFMEAAETLAVDHDVVIVGSSGFGGELDQRAEELSRRLPRLRWLGHLRDDALLHALWSNAGVYFHGHSVGGTNPTLVQAMAVGSPVVARDTIYNREVLGAAGHFVGASAAAIEGGVRALLADEDARAEQAKLLRERATNVYSWARVNRAYERLLRATAHGSRKG